MLTELPRHKRKAKVALKFCGCCNPQVDLGRVAGSLAKIAEQGEKFQLVPLSENDIDIVVILCGCSRACGDKEEVKAKALQNLVVAGERVGWEKMQNEHLPAAVQGELERLMKAKLSVD
jgi:hypothetical protein